MNQEKIGKFITALRKEKNLTQEQLAEKLGVSNKSVSRWENGKTMPDYSLLKDICNELSVNINELISGEKIEEENYIIKAEENLFLLKKRLDKLVKIVNCINSVTSRSIFVLFIIRVLTKYLSIEIFNIPFFRNMLFILFFISTVGLIISFILEVFIYEDNKK